METEKSLYELIIQNIKHGKLPDGFTLPYEENETGLSFADGAMDGITVYHMGSTGIDADGTRQMIKALKHAAEYNMKEADAAFAELGKNFRAITIIDDLQKYIIKHSKKLSAENVYQTAMHMILHSKNRESVKFGLSMLELFNVADEPTKEIVRRIGSSDEFTIFAVWNMLRWENANDEIFGLIQNVHGWGRIHALERLEAETPEIRKWMILDGINNSVMPAYSALTVWKKADAETYLRGQLDREEFSAIGKIISALLDEGPAPGISEVENAEDVIEEYLAKTDEFDLDIDNYETIYDINIWASNEEVDLPDIVRDCMDILSSDDCEETVREAVKSGDGLKLASALDIDYADDLLEVMKRDFEHHYFQCTYLMALEDHVDQVLDLFREELPLDEMRKDPGDETGLEYEFGLYNKLAMIIAGLDNYPNTGEDLIVAGLWSPVISTRNTALRVLEVWTRTLQMPISEVSETVFGELEEVITKEVNSDIKERMQYLIEGIIPDDTDEEEYEDE